MMIKKSFFQKESFIKEISYFMHYKAKGKKEKREIFIM